jgi:hypothetical protein
MTERPPAVAPETAEDRISVASNWRLVWWRFRKHRLALLSALVLLALYGIVLFPDFLSVPRIPRRRRLVWRSSRCSGSTSSTAGA